MENSKRFAIKGDRVYVNNLVVKFEDRNVENADLDRATSLVMFQRTFGGYQEPRDVFPLENIGERPKSCSDGSKLSQFG